jgi:hypothetical protein
MREGDEYPKCFDPYLRYAISTNFRDFEFFDSSSMLFFLVEFNKTEGAADHFEREMNDPDRSYHPERMAEVGPAHDKALYATVRGKLGMLDPKAFSIWNKHVSRVELSLPVKPSSRVAPFRKQPVCRWEEGKDPSPSLLIGVLDDGCPFAAAHFLQSSTNGSLSTRVRGIWDQNQGRQPAEIIPGRPFGQTLADFGYGLEYRRDFAPSLGVPQMGLDEWIGLHLTPAGSVDEDGCYARAGFTSLTRQDSHGAHVMDVFAGRFPTSSRIGPSHQGQDRRDPPTWKAGADAASAAEMVFVQFSDNCIRDATGVWLKAYVVDGIRYIMSFADPHNTKNVIINLSYGPTTGPHDGTAELEAALSALVAEFNGTTGKPKLEIVLAAGNACLSEGHVVFTNDNEQTAEVEWIWRLPPDNTVLCFAEIWMDDACADDVSVTLTSPSGNVSLTSSGSVAHTPGSLPIPGGSTAQLLGPIVWGNDRMWLLEVGPSIAAPGIVANEHGDWKIKVGGIWENAQVHAYVARSDPNMGVRTGAKRSCFVDPKWEQARSAAANCTLEDGEFDTTGSLVCRDGTLNGIATAKRHRVHVAGGYVLTDGRKTPYSSEGPARRGPRAGPDFAMLCDESWSLTGVRAGGNRSGAVFRLTGTSAAAPQLARQVADVAGGLPFPPPVDVPSNTDIVEIHKRGGGNIEPP